MLELTLYHALVSITLPVLVVASLWPAEREHLWLSRKAMVIMLGIMVAMSLLGWFFLSPAEEWPPYLPGLGQFVGSVIAIVALVWLAWRIKPRPNPSTLTRRWPLFLAGLAWGVWILGLWIISENTHSAPLTLLWTGLVAVGLLAFSYMRVRALDPAALVGAGTLAAGTFLFWTLLAFIQELDNVNRLDDTSGMALVGLVGLVALGGYLVYLARQWRQVRTGVVTGVKG